MYNANIDAVLQDACSAKVSTAIDFASGYWRLSLHQDSQHLHACTTLDVVIQPRTIKKVDAIARQTFRPVLNLVRKSFEGTSLRDWMTLSSFIVPKMACYACCKDF